MSRYDSFGCPSPSPHKIFLGWLVTSSYMKMSILLANLPDWSDSLGCLVKNINFHPRRLIISTGTRALKWCRANVHPVDPCSFFCFRNESLSLKPPMWSHTAPHGEKNPDFRCCWKSYGNWICSCVNLWEFIPKILVWKPWTRSSGWLIESYYFGAIKVRVFLTKNRVVVSNIFYFHPHLGKIPILTNIFQRGWNHQPEKTWGSCYIVWSQRTMSPSKSPYRRCGKRWCDWDDFGMDFWSEVYHLAWYQWKIFHGAKNRWEKKHKQKKTYQKLAEHPYSEKDILMHLFQVALYFFKSNCSRWE